MNWVLTIFDWMPLIGGWAFIPQLLVIWIALLAIYVASYAISVRLIHRHRGDQGSVYHLTRTVSAGSLTLGILSLFLIPLAAIAVAIAPPEPPPARTAPIVGVENMDQKVFHVQGDGGQRATVVVYGQREGAAFEVRGYRVKITGGSIRDQAGFTVYRSLGYRSGFLGVESAEPIRADGQWQWGRFKQRGSFFSEETYGLSFWFDDIEIQSSDVRMPVTF